MICRFLRRILFLLPMALGVIGCADDLRNEDIFAGSEYDVEISYSVDKSSSTRTGSSSDWESVIGHAWLLFYEEGDSFDDDMPVAAVRAEVKDNASGVLSFRMPLRLEENKDYQLIALANADDYVPGGFSGYGDYILNRNTGNSEDGYGPLQMFRQDPILSGSVSTLPMAGKVADGDRFRFPGVMEYIRRMHR